MTVVIDDKFTEGSDANLVDHTPTDTGTGWTEIERTGARFGKIFAPGTVSANSTENDDRCLYTAQGTYTTADYDVELLLGEFGTITSVQPFIIMGRLTDSSNYYAAIVYEALAGNDLFIGKKVAGTWTDLASADTDIAVTEVLKLELRTVAKKVYLDDVEKLSTADNALTSVGEAGLGLGNVRVSTDDIGNLWDNDNFLVTELVAAAADDEDPYWIATGQQQPVFEVPEVVGY